MELEILDRGNQGVWKKKKDIDRNENNSEIDDRRIDHIRCPLENEVERRRKKLILLNEVLSIIPQLSFSSC